LDIPIDFFYIQKQYGKKSKRKQINTNKHQNLLTTTAVITAAVAMLL
jgi:hypothetical protein